MEKINIRYIDTPYRLKGTRLELLEAKSKLETRELEMWKVHYNSEDAVTSLHTRLQEGHQGNPKRAVIDSHVVGGEY